MQPQRRIPYHMRKEVSKELEKLVKQDIIEKVVDQPTPWISPVVCTPKKDGGIHFCVDLRAANQAIERERHIMPTIQDFIAEVNGSKYFSKIDLKQAYHQLELTPESRYITTFSTHEGLYRYKRLNYGTCSPGGGGGGHFHSKVIGMLVIFLGYKILILVFFRVFWKRFLKIEAIFPKTALKIALKIVIWVFFRGLKSKSGYFLGFSKKISIEHTYHFYIKGPPGHAAQQKFFKTYSSET